MPHWLKSPTIRTKKMKVSTSISNSVENLLIFLVVVVVFKVDPDVLSQRSNYRSTLSVNEVISSEKRDFKIMVETKSKPNTRCIHLVAPTVQDKEAWISDISQCIDNIHLHSVNSFESIGPQLSLHSDPRLFTDDIDIRFSRTLNSCKLPQVRYATPERLLQRLTGERIKSNHTGSHKTIKCWLCFPFPHRFAIFVNWFPQHVSANVPCIHGWRNRFECIEKSFLRCSTEWRRRYSTWPSERTSKYSWQRGKWQFATTNIWR